MSSLADYIAGEWRAPSNPDGEVARENPARTSELVFRCQTSLAHVDEAVEAARAAQPAWDRLGFEARRDALERFAAELEARAEEIARTIALEVGKPLWEARGEARALPAKIRIMSGEGAEHTAPTRPEGLDGEVRHRPLGVLAVLGPFNFPLHLPNGHVAPALLTGNAVVIKPSEAAPRCMTLYAQAAQAAGLPPGVLNVVQGAGAAGARLAAHPGVDGVLFTGSYDVGLAIKRATLEQHWKLLALEMGGKNTCVVLEDADLDRATYEIAQAAFLTTGQRCSATSRVVARRELADALTDRLADVARRVTAGDPLGDPQPFMGPLATRGAFEKVQAAMADDEGGALTPIVRGGAHPELGDQGYFVTPALWRCDALDPRGSHQAEEVFGPDVIVYAVDSDEEAARVANATEYGLAMSVFTSDRGRFDALSYQLQTGILNLNRSTVGASSRLPFGGVKKSGNHRPAAALAGLYCTYPQARLHVPAAFDASELDAHPLDLLAPKGG